MTTYGIIKHAGTTKRIMTKGSEFKAPCFVGVGASPAKEFKTRMGAKKVADRYGASVMVINNGIMQY